MSWSLQYPCSTPTRNLNRSNYMHLCTLHLMKSMRPMRNPLISVTTQLCRSITSALHDHKNTARQPPAICRNIRWYYIYYI